MTSVDVLFDCLLPSTPVIEEMIAGIFTAIISGWAATCGKCRTHAVRAGKCSLSARTLPSLNAAPVFRTLRRETPGFTGCADRRGRKVAPTPLGLVMLPHDWSETLALVHEGFALLDGTSFAPPKAGGLAPQVGSDGRGLRPPLQNRRLGAYFRLGENFFVAPPSQKFCPLGRTEFLAAAARCSLFIRQMPTK